MQGFLWVIFLKKAMKALCYPALLTVDGWFHFFSSNFYSENHSSPRYCSLKLVYVSITTYIYSHAPLQMGIYNNYSGYFKVRRRLYVGEPFDKLNLSGKNVKKWA